MSELDDLTYCDCGHAAIMHWGWIRRRAPAECCGMRLHADRSITNCKCRQFRSADLATAEGD